MLIWFHKVTRKLMGISFEYTSLNDVKLAAAKLRTTNTRAVKEHAEGKTDSHCCSYVEEMKNGWDFKPEDAIPMNMYGDDEAARKTLKFGTKLVTNAIGHDKTRHSLVLTADCKEQFLGAIREMLPKMPESNQTFFNSREWEFEKKYGFESEDKAMPPPEKVKRVV